MLSLAHPIGGLGQDNFAEYYVPRRRTREEPSWTHSLELRLLAHTGLVGFVLFAAFLVAAVSPRCRCAARRRGGLDAAVAATALLPFVVWLIHGSVDWFWEVPALTGPALGFLGMAGALGARAPSWPVSAACARHPRPQAPRSRPPARRTLGVRRARSALLAAGAVLAFPYLSVREVSLASDIRRSDPGGGAGRPPDARPTSIP